MVASATVAVGALGVISGLVSPAAAAGPSITVSPSTGLKDGQNVTVKGSGFTANYANMVVVQCAASATGASGCNVNDVKFTKADANGAFTVTLTIKEKFGSTDCSKVECIVQGHEGFSDTSGKTGTSSALHFGAAAKPSPTPTHTKTTAAPPAASTTANSGSSSASSGSNGAASNGGSNGDASSSSAAGVAGVSTAVGSAQPTGANTGKAVITSVPLISEVGLAAALLLLFAGGLLYRRRSGARSGR